MNIVYFLEKIDFYLWNIFLIYPLIFVGLYLTIKLKGLQFRYFFLSLKLAFSKHKDEGVGEISHFGALMTSLAGTIGIGSIAGMATTILAGGYGSIFWMWIVSLILMAARYSEAILAVKYRQIKNNKIAGGPMYYIKHGLNSNILSYGFAIFGILASFCGGNLIQSQTISDSVHELFNIPHVITGLLISFFAFISIIKGIKNLGKINSYLVPIMAILYLSGAIYIIAINYQMIIPSFFLIFKSAFNTKAMAVGSFGAGIMSAIQIGVARGIASNEAGLGTAAIASSAAKTNEPAKQALISISSVFLSTFVVCTITVLLLMCTNVVGIKDLSGNFINGAPLVMKAFSKHIIYGNYIVGICVILFGFTTILGYAYYVEKCFEYVFKNQKFFMLRIVFVLVSFLGAMLSIKVVWPLADIFNGLMAIFNIIAIFLLSKVVLDETKSYFLLKHTKDKSLFQK
ncbi:MAG: Amino-acid carrier protein AlsT [Candidatus Anoxychlamydiales bacterium]|nr:Amino-acid carrier protein AlsT [Candidatus Anoxychlamydiales bacterium]